MDHIVSGPLWRFIYQQTRADWAAWQALPRELYGWRRWLYFVLAAVAGGLWGLTEDVLGIHPPEGWGMWLVVLVIVGFVYGVHALVLSVDRRIKIAARPLPTGQTSVEVFDDHVVVAADGNTRKLLWDKIGNQVITQDHLFLELGADNAVILPLRCFEDKAQMALFAAFAHDKIWAEEPGGV